MEHVPITKERLTAVIWLLQRRLGADWLKQIATGSGVEEQTVLDWNSGTRLPSPAELRKLSDYDAKIRYSERGNDPSEWFKKAEELLAAGDALKVCVDEYWNAIEKLSAGEDIELPADVSMQLLMLRSFHLECLFKGLVLMKGVHLMKDGKYSGRKHHKLNEYAKEAGIKLSPQESEMLDRLEKHTALGRYPVLVHSDDEVFWSRIDRQPKCHWSDPEDENTFTRLLSKVYERIPRNMTRTF